MNSNGEIIRLCDRIMAFCNRLNKRLDAIEEQEQPGYQHYSHQQPLTAAYRQPPYASFDSGVNNTGWPPPPTAPEPVMQPEPYHIYPSPTPEPDIPYYHYQPSVELYPPVYNREGYSSNSFNYSVDDYLPYNDSWQPGTTCWDPPTPAFEQPPYTYMDSYALLQIPYAGDHREQSPSCSKRRSTTAPLPPVAAAPNSTPTYTTSAIPLPKITQSRSGPEHPAVASVPPPPQAAISSTCSPNRIDRLSPAPLPIVPPPQTVLSPPCSLEMINIAVQRRGKSSILSREIESILTNQGTIGRIASINQDYEREEKQVQSREMIECSLQLKASRLQILQTQIDLGNSMEDNTSLELLSDSSHVRGVASMNHQSTSLDADARLIPPRHDTPSPKLCASPSWFDMSVVKVFVPPYYLHNFVRSTFNGLGVDKIKGVTLVVYGPFILTANSNPGGPNEDFRIKKNMENSGKYVSVHLRFEEDMVSFYGCVYDGGEQDKLHMNVVRKRDWKGRIITSFEVGDIRPKCVSDDTLANSRKINTYFELGDVILFGSGRRIDKLQEFHDVFLGSRIFESGCLLGYWFPP